MPYKLNETFGNIWDWLGIADCIVVTTNCEIKKDNRLVMGLGTAKELRDIIPNIDLKAGQMVKKLGPVPFIVHKIGKTNIVLFPVKPAGKIVKNLDELVTRFRNKFKIGSYAPGWAFKADLNLIENSIKFLVNLANTHNWNLIVMPRIGCGGGELEWKEVKKVLEKYIDNRFLIAVKCKTNKVSNLTLPIP